MTDRQDKSSEIGTESLLRIDKLDKSTQSDFSSSQLTDTSLKFLPEFPLKPPNSLNNSCSPEFPLIQVQSLFRGYLCRLPPNFPSSYQPELLSEIPSTISTFEAKQAYARLSPFRFSKPPGSDLSSWRGPTRLQDGSIYVGEWSITGTPTGKGIMYYIDGGICEGYWREGRLHDKGRRVSPSGDVYTGSWYDGKMEGQGVMEYSSKIVYSGGWVNNRQHGLGTENWPDGSRFEGNYRDGAKCGRGRLLWPDRTLYEGEFSEDAINGFGKCKWGNREYEGYWNNGKMHGKGNMRWSDGKSYDGEFYMGVKEGYGIIRFSDGRRHKGIWKGGRLEKEI